jgi:HSP20 family protein
METKLVPRLAELSPWSLEPLENRIKRLFEMSFPTFSVEEAVGWMPPSELLEKEGEFVLTMELPGVKKEDVAIDLDHNILTISGEKKDSTEKKSARRHMWERSYGSFTRTLALPSNVEPGAIKADFKEGILTVELPKTKEAKGRRIEIG